MALRKIIRAATLLLTGACLAAPTVRANAGADANVYKTDGEYEVTIPSEMTVAADSNTGTLPIEGTLGAYYNLDITVASENNFYLVNGGSKVGYTLSSQHITFDNRKGSTDTEIQYNLSLSVKDTAYVSGKYTDRLTFTMSASEYELANGEHWLTFNRNCTDDVAVSPAKIYVKEDAAYGTLPELSRDGYTFMGWYTEAAAGTKVTADTVMGKADTVIYAHWKENVLTINYHNDGAQTWLSYITNTPSDVSSTDIVESETVGYASSYQHVEFGILDVNRFTKAGYHSGFRWKFGSRTSNVTVIDTDNGVKQYGTDGAAVATLLGVLGEFKKGNVTVDLYPVFDANTYTISYSANAEGAAGGTASSNHTYDAEAPLTKNCYTREGYTFDCWNTNADGSGKSYNDEEEVKNLSAESDGKVTLYAQWRENVLTINYHNDGAQWWYPYSQKDPIKAIEMDIVETEYAYFNTEYAHLSGGLLNVARFVKPGYHTGYAWRIGSKDSDHIVTDEDDGTTGVSNYGKTGTAVAEFLGKLEDFKKGDVTVDLYPVFAANTYTISYNANADDATGAMSPSSHTYGAEAPLTKNCFTREGYTFGGWAANADGTGNTYANEQAVSNLTTKNGDTVALYAIWIADTASSNAKSHSLLLFEDEPPLATDTDADSE